jgi:hypothetical protein
LPALCLSLRRAGADDPRMRHAAFAFVLLLCASRAVSAQPGAQRAEPLAEPAAEPPASYATTTLAVDGASLALVIAGAMTETTGGRDGGASPAMLAAGVLGISLGSPIVHAAHGHWGRAGASLGLRYGLATVGALAAVQLTSCDTTRDSMCKLGGASLGVLFGLAAASLIDGMFQTGAADERRDQRADRHVDERADGRAATRAPRRSWIPTVAAAREGVHLGLATLF